MSELDVKETAAGEDVPAAEPEIRFVADRPRSKTVPLEWPLEYDGNVYREVVVSRLSGAEVRALVSAATAGTGELDLYKMLDCPRAVYEALDDDDLAEVDKVIEDFLPRRLREAAGLTPASGEDS